MRNLVRYIGVLVLAVTLLGGAPEAMAGSFMPTSGPTSQPVGHFEFCKRYAPQCEANAKRAVVKMTAATWARIVAVNEFVNGIVTPRTDEEMYGVAEV